MSMSSVVKGRCCSKTGVCHISVNIQQILDLRPCFLYILFSVDPIPDTELPS